MLFAHASVQVVADRCGADLLHIKADESVAGEAPADRRRHESAVRRAPMLCIVEPRSRDIVAFLDRLVADGVLDVRVGSDPR